MRGLVSLFLFIIAAFSVSAQTITVAFPEHIPPWVIQTEERGISIDIVSQALASEGVTVIPYYIPFTRMASVLNQESVDAVAMVEGRKIKNGCYSDITTYFSTSLISLEKSNFQLSRIDELIDKRTLAFQDASKIFPDLKLLAEKSSQYQEIANQENQVALLFKERVDFIVVDENIFHFWRHALTKVDSSKPVVFHELDLISSIQVKSPTRVVFKEQSSCDAFNNGLAKLVESGEYQHIIDSYIKPSVRLLQR
ncbi:substrate-binding periplasmic protein [Thalassotalea fusca]